MEAWLYASNLERQCKEITIRIQSEINRFSKQLRDLFRIALAEALYAMKIEEGEMLLQFQKEPNRPSPLDGVNKKTGLKRTKSAISN